VELRSAVQAQLENLRRQMGRLQEDLDATKMELAEVVIDKENSQTDLIAQVDCLRGDVSNDLDKLRQDILAERADTIMDEVNHLVESRVQEGKDETMDLLKKIDKVVRDQRDQLDNLRRALGALEERQEAERQTAAGQFRHLEECRELVRDAQNLEPRISVLEDSEHNFKSVREHMQQQVQDLHGLIAAHVATSKEAQRNLQAVPAHFPQPVKGVKVVDDASAAGACMSTRIRVRSEGPPPLAEVASASPSATPLVSAVSAGGGSLTATAHGSSIVALGSSSGRGPATGAPTTTTTAAPRAQAVPPPASPTPPWSAPQHGLSHGHGHSSAGANGVLAASRPMRVVGFISSTGAPPATGLHQ